MLSSTNFSKSFFKILKKNGWDFFSYKNQILIFKKIIEIDDFYLEISYLNGIYYLNVKTYLYYPYEKNYKALYLINYLNQISDKGKYIFNEHEKTLVYLSKIEREIFWLMERKERYGIFEDLLKEIDVLSYHASLGFHQIIFSNKNIEVIKNSILIKTIGNA